MHQFDHPIDHEHAHTLLRPTKAPRSRVPLAPCRGRRRNSAQRLEGGCFDDVQYLASWGPCIRLIWGRQASVKDRKRVVGGWLGKRYDEASDSRRYGSCGVVFALPDPPHLLSPPRARRTDRCTSQWHVASTPDSLKQPYAALHRRTTMAADRGCARVVVLTSRCMGAVMVLEKRLEHVTAPIQREVRFFLLLWTWWRGASTRAVADVDISSNSRSGIESSGLSCAPCVASATPSASAASSPSLAVANGAFGASSLTAAPKCAPISAEKRGVTQLKL